MRQSSFVPGTLALVVLAVAAGAGPARAAYDPTDAYVPRTVEGWTVRVHQKLLAPEQRELCDRTLRLLENQLYRITRVVPTAALAELRKFPIWVELNHPRHLRMCYHPSPDWLREHDMNSEKAGGVEIANAAAFLAWTHDQPWMVLHELAHGYHHKVLGYDHPEIAACLARAKEAKLYESVLHINGRKVRHYALTNPMDYFAEATEAYFGTNDFYPFVRAELREYDPAMFELLERLWKATGAGPPRGKGKPAGAGSNP
jgi:hypothetical protein